MCVQPRKESFALEQRSLYVRRRLAKSKAELSRLLALVESGEEVVIARRGKHIARLVRINPKVARQPDVLKEALQIPDSFFAPLASKDLECWEGR